MTNEELMENFKRFFVGGSVINSEEKFLKETLVSKNAAVLLKIDGLRTLLIIYDNKEFYALEQNLTILQFGNYEQKIKEKELELMEAKTEALRSQKHMEEAIKILCESRFNELVELIDKDEFTADPMDAYVNKIYSKNAPLKTAVVWNDKFIDMEK